ncbi:MAG: TfoX/Sxy family protein [Gammaproteobacteria bacterium]|nr:TfoX/Sxy family protein [Gammaproteobacteria bacterium]
MNGFVEHLHEVFSEFGRIDARRMFGGHGIFHDGLMFALVADDTLYLKADDESAYSFETRGLARFQYNKGGGVLSMSYFEAPEEIYDDPAEAVIWARRAHDAALRTKRRTGRRK